MKAHEIANKIGLVCFVVLAMTLANCGKKKNEPKKVLKAEAPAYKESVADYLDNEPVSEFAFVDDAANKKDDKAEQVVAKAEIPTNENELVAFNDVDSTEMPLAEENNLVASNDSATKEESFDFKPVRFDFNKNSIRPDQKPVVVQDCKVAKMAAEKGKNIVIQGHCDQIGSASYNMVLSQRRAEAIKKELINEGIPAEKVKTVGYGYEMPIVWSDARERAALIKELAPNRRAEFTIN